MNLILSHISLMVWPHWRAKKRFMWRQLCNRCKVADTASSAQYEHWTGHEEPSLEFSLEFNEGTGRPATAQML